MANIVRKFHLPPGDEEVEWAPPTVRKHVLQLDRRPAFERKRAEGTAGVAPCNSN